MAYGNPEFERGDMVEFTVTLPTPIGSDAEPETVTLVGSVFIVDAHGTWENPYECSYDILVPDFGKSGTLFKHIVERHVSRAEPASGDGGGNGNDNDE